MPHPLFFTLDTSGQATLLPWNAAGNYFQLLPTDTARLGFRSLDEAFGLIAAPPIPPDRGAAWFELGANQSKQQGPSILTDEATNSRIRKQLGTILKGFAGSHCASVFASTIPQFSVSLFTGKLSGARTNYYDTTLNPIASWTQTETTGNDNNTPLASSLPLGATAITINGGLQKQTAVLLGANFFSQSPAGQADTLLHEGIHSFANWSDQNILDAFKNDGLQNINNFGSVNISNWIGTDCKSTP